MKKFEPAILIPTDSGHYYETPKGDIYPGITTILSVTGDASKMEGLQRWRDSEPNADYIMKHSASIGKETHSLVEFFVRYGAFPDSNNLFASAHAQNLLPFLNDITNPRAVETSLYSDKLKISGTVDCIADYKKIPSIIDYKTKRSNQRKNYLTDYFIQGTAYAEMWEELTGEEITQVVILVSSEKNTRKEFIIFTLDYLDMLYERIDRYYEMGGF